MFHPGELTRTTTSFESPYRPLIKEFYLGERRDRKIPLIANIKRNDKGGDKFILRVQKHKELYHFKLKDSDDFSLDVWRRRLTPRKRPDARKFYGFWMAEDFENYDDFDLLGLTQGLSPTDSYEFLAVYKYALGFRFVTDVFRPAASDAERLAAWTRAKEGDELTFEVKKDGSPAAQDAVEVFCQKESIGFIKPGHCNYFFEAKKENITPYLRAKRKIDFGPRQSLFVEVGTPSE